MRLLPALVPLGKMAIDVGVYEPLYDTGYIFIQSLMRGDGVRGARTEVRAKVLRLWRMALRYWPFADMFNFGLVPLRLRPLVNAILTIPWSMYLSSTANAKSTTR